MWYNENHNGLQLIEQNHTILSLCTAKMGETLNNETRAGSLIDKDKANLLRIRGRRSGETLVPRSLERLWSLCFI